MAVKYDEAVKSYTPEQLNQAKSRAKKHYITNKGEVSVKVLSRIGKVPQGYIRDWMKEEDWQLELNPVQVTDKLSAEQFGLSEQEESFCYHYIHTYNATTSAIRAGYSSSYGHNKAYRLLKDERIRKFITELRDLRNSEVFLDSVRILQEYIKVAFADITDFVEFSTMKNKKGEYKQYIKMKNSNEVDGTMIKEVSLSERGVLSFKLHDKMPALEKLSKYFKLFDSDDEDDDFVNLLKKAWGVRANEGS